MRIELNDEAHARPSKALQAPLRLTFLALYSEPSQRDREWLHVCELARRFGREPPLRASHYSADLGPFRLKWERHSEFTRYKFIVGGLCADPFDSPALQAVPADWLAGLPGEVMVATHAALLKVGAEAPDYEALATRHFGGNVLVGAGIAAGAGLALTDFRIRDGFSRLLVFDRSMTPRQAGRMMQRLLEIDTYRLTALLALPVAHGLTPSLNDAERELAQITAALVESNEAAEPVLLERLTRLEAEIESREAAHHFRFSAAEAYPRSASPISRAEATEDDPQVHYDAGRILFSYRKGGDKHYHLYEINTDGTGLKQLTDGPYDDIEPTYLPNGDIVFVSTRCQRWVNCWLTQVAILYRCDANGGKIRPISSNNEHENTPWPLPDGRILYMRWEYEDRSQVDYHHLWTVHPDGTEQNVFFGNLHPGTAMWDAKPIPHTSTARPGARTANGYISFRTATSRARSSAPGARGSPSPTSTKQPRSTPRR